MKSVWARDAFHRLVGLRCVGCHKCLVIQDCHRTIIKGKLFVVDEEKGNMEIKCDRCGKILTVTIN